MLTSNHRCLLWDSSPERSKWDNHTKAGWWFSPLHSWHTTALIKYQRQSFYHTSIHHPCSIFRQILELSYTLPYPLGRDGQYHLKSHLSTLQSSLPSLLCNNSHETVKLHPLFALHCPCIPSSSCHLFTQVTRPGWMGHLMGIPHSTSHVSWCAFMVP